MDRIAIRFMRYGNGDVALTLLDENPRQDCDNGPSKTELNINQMAFRSTLTTKVHCKEANKSVDHVRT